MPSPSRPESFHRSFPPAGRRDHAGAAPVRPLSPPRAWMRAVHGAGAWIAHGVVGPLIEQLFPAACPSCEKPLPGISRAGLCGACWASLRPVRSPLCPRCGVPFPRPFPALPARPEASPASPPPWPVSAASSVSLAATAAGPLPENRTCGRCLRRPPAFDGARCALMFEGAVRTLLHLFKFDDRRDLARPLARALLAALPPSEGFDLVVPVPLHWTRRLSRGYNQAALLASRIARARRLRFGRRILVKKKRTVDQAHLDAAARRENLRGSFAVRATRRGAGRLRRIEPSGASRARPLSGLRILQVDDVLTTGATAEACARALKSAGAARVFVVAVARTPLRAARGGSPADPDGYNRAASETPSR